MKSVLGDGNDYSLDVISLVFGQAATPINCIENDEQCFTFEATQDLIKEDEEKFKIYLSSTDPYLNFCGAEGHISIPVDPNDGM